MAIIMFKCPFCGKKVETPEDNVGREGLCPGCQKIFEIPEPAKGKREAARATKPTLGIGFLAGSPPEYQEFGAIIGAAIVALGLAAIAATTFLPWVQIGARSGPVVAQEQGFILFGSAACFIFMAISAGTRKSLVPALLCGGGWGMFALVWIGSILHTLDKAVQGTIVKSPVVSGLYLAMVACLVAMAGAVFFYYQVRDGDVMEKLGFFLVSTQVVALIVALVLADHRLKPILMPPAAAPAAQAVDRSTPKPAMPAPPATPPAIPKPPTQ